MNGQKNILFFKNLIHLQVRPTVKGRIHPDEKYVKVKKNDYYNLNAIDSKTKYVLAHLFSEKRTIKKCVEFLSQIKATCYEQILAVYEKEKKKPKRN